MSGIRWGASEEAFKALHNAILSPNRAVKPEINLAIARSDKSLVDEGVLPSSKVFLYLTILKKGTGTWSFKMKFDNDSVIEYLSGDLTDSYLMDRRFADILFTNTSQTVVNPVLLVEWKE